MNIRIAGIVNESVVDGPGVRMVIFTQGCPHNCPGCHNPETHDPAGGELRDTDELIAQLRQSRYVSGVTISGGEPFFQPEAAALLAEAARELGKNVMVYSGYTFEQLTDIADSQPETARLLAATDILVDGPYLEERRNIDLTFRGSDNQRILDMPASLRQGRAVIMTLGRESHK